MRRKSVKKSSMFKVQADKTIYKKYLDQVSTCATVISYPHLLEVNILLFSQSKELLKLFLTTVTISQIKLRFLRASTMDVKIMGFHFLPRIP